MPDESEPESHTLRWMRRIDAKLDLLADIARETRTPVGIMEQQYGSLSARIDRIEDRLDLVDSAI